jgi:hypothetical protein
MTLAKITMIYPKGYASSIIKNLKRTKDFGLRYIESEDYSSLIRMYRQLYGKRLPYFSAEDFIRFEKVCIYLARENNVIVRMVFHGSELLAGVILLKDKKRIYNIISCLTDKGRNWKPILFFI